MGALQHFTPAPPAAVSRVLSTFGRAELEGFIAVAIDLLDLAEPDPDAEEIGLEDSFMAHHAEGPGCPVADSGSDQAYVEWDSIPARARRTRATNCNPGREDDETTGAEDDAHPEGGNFAQKSAGQHVVGGAGCPISDPDFAVDDKPCDDDFDLEREQMVEDVPCVSVYSLDQNPFNDQRTYLGRSNVTTAFRGEVRSADTGAQYNGRGMVPPVGVPV